VSPVGIQIRIGELPPVYGGDDGNKSGLVFKGERRDGAFLVPSSFELVLWAR
jgi:hypothetical protein